MEWGVAREGVCQIQNWPFEMCGNSKFEKPIKVKQCSQIGWQMEYGIMPCMCCINFSGLT